MDEFEEVTQMIAAAGGAGMDADEVAAVLGWAAANRDLLRDLVTIRSRVESGHLTEESWARLVEGACAVSNLKFE